MNIFELSWHDYDELSYWLFSHDNKNQDDFNNDVNFLLKKYGEEYINNEKSWVGACYWIGYIVPKMEELGYTKVEPIKWSFTGAGIINFDNIISEDDLRWSEVVGEDLLFKAARHNDIVDDNLHND